MTKLEAIIKIYDEFGLIPEEEGLSWDCVFEAARAYAALLKLAPEIGALVEALEMRSLLDKGTAAHLARPTLKAIHDNLTKWGE